MSGAQAQAATRPGARNLITDVAGIKVGNATDLTIRTGVTVILCDHMAIAAADIRGGAPGTRETDLLKSENAGYGIHALVLSGGSALGLEAASGVAAALSARGHGLRFVPTMPAIPLVPSAILFDLTNGGTKDWGMMPPYRDLGIQALDAVALDFALGTAGAGTGAKAGLLKGGLGSASTQMPSGVTIGALAAVNSIGSVLVPGTATFWATPYAAPGELGVQSPILSQAAGFGFPPDAKVPVMGTNTTICAIAIDADLTKTEVERVAIMAQDGLARAIRPAHTPYDGDSVFVLATGVHNLSGDRARHVMEIGTIAGDTLARAIARGVYEATSLGEMISYREQFGL